MSKLIITPRFNVQEIIAESIEKDWRIFQMRAFELGKRTLNFMRHYISANIHRGSTGNLARALTFEGNISIGEVHWGIGNMNLLRKSAPYWYVLNYGAKITGEKFIPGMGKFVPGFFGEGNRPDSSLAGVGSEYFTHTPYSGMGMTPKTFRPINYIEASRHKLDAEFRALLLGLKGI